MKEFEVGDKVLVEMEIICEGLGEYSLSCEGCPDSLYLNKKILGKVATKKTYEDGMEEAWETAQWIACNPNRVRVFGTFDLDRIFKDHTWQEAAAKIRAWEDAKEIHVGDVVKMTEGKFEGVVSKVKGSGCYVVFGDGSSGRFAKDDLTKTGRKIDIAGLLAEIGGAENETD